MQHKSKDIITLESNRKGEDYLIGDVHGNSDCLGSIIDSLQPDDRLFITGDLIDRGKDSCGVIFQLLQEKRVFSVLGNHELLFLDSLKSLEKVFIRKNQFVDIKEKPDSLHYGLILPDLKLPKNKVHNMRLARHLKNGGHWLFVLFIKECRSKQIQIIDNRMCYMNGSRIGQIKSYIESLPYIIHVGGATGFNVVHADMPFDDENLLHKIAHAEPLPDFYKRYTTWARDKPDNSVNLCILAANGRNKTSVATFTGHNILDLGSEPFRETNTYNLDVATFRTNISLVVNVTACHCFYVGDTVAARQSDFYQSVLGTVQLQLGFRRIVQLFLKEISGCITANQVLTVAKKWTTIPLGSDKDTCFWKEESLMLCAINHGVISDGVFKRLSYASSHHVLFSKKEETVAVKKVVCDKDNEPMLEFK